MKNVFTVFAVSALLLVGLASMSSTANAGWRHFYWTGQSQSNAYNVADAQSGCYERAIEQARPYAWNTCYQKLGQATCAATAKEEIQYWAPTGGPGLYECQVRVWVSAWENSNTPGPSGLNAPPVYPFHN